MDHKPDSPLIAFIQENQEKFYRIAYAHVKNRDDALDLVHTSIVKALQKQHTLRKQDGMRTGFYRILINECMTYFRKRSRLIYLADLGEDLPARSGQPQSQDTYLDLYSAIDHLPSHLKTVVILRYFEDLKLATIAEVTGTNLNTTKSRLYKALELLKLDLGGMEDDRSFSV